MNPAETSSQRVFREDVLLFINGCFAATAQGGFYRREGVQRLSIEFLHAYMRYGYRRVYALTLAAGINDFNTALIIRMLLAHPRESEHHPQENALITEALRRLPPQRVYRLFKELRERRVNNRRTRALMRRYVEGRGRPEFDAVKYRAGLTSAVRHARLPLTRELGTFLFRGKKQKQFESPLLESWRAAHYAQDAMYRLPYTVAEGFAEKHGVPRKVFLKKIAPQLTKAERERLDRSAAKLGVDVGADLSKMPLLKLSSYVLSVPTKERARRGAEIEAAFERAAARVAGHRTSGGRVALVLDDSYSTLGARATRQRPLALALGVHYLLRASYSDVRSHWLHGPDGAFPFLVRPRGQTNLAASFLAALEDEPDVVFVVSDGWENDPPGATAATLELFSKLKRECLFVHANPVFDGERFEPRSLSPLMATLGVRQPEDLLTSLAYARFALGHYSALELEERLEKSARSFLGGVRQ